MVDDEAAIIARLDGIPGCRGVHGMVDYQKKVQAGKQLPAIFVGSEGYTVEKITGQGQSALLAIRWIIVIVGRDVSDIRSGQPARGTVASVARSAFARLIGWHPPSGKPMTPLDGYMPVYEGGLLKYPLVFESKTHISNEAQA